VCHAILYLYIQCHFRPAVEDRQSANPSVSPSTSSPRKPQQLLGDFIATLGADTNDTAQDLRAIICSGIILSRLAARKARQASCAVQFVFSLVEVTIDRLEELPSAARVLSDLRFKVLASRKSLSDTTVKHFHP